MNYNQIEQFLKDVNLSVTQNRIDIIKCLMHEPHFHSIQDIANHLKNINLKSLYNNIKILLKNNIVEEYSFNGIAKFALNDNLKNTSPTEAHIVDPSGNIKHLHIDKDIYEKIKKNVDKEIKSIKIFIEIK